MTFLALAPNIELAEFSFAQSSTERVGDALRGRWLNGRFAPIQAESRLSAFVKGSGRRRRTEVPEARTRGPHALGYGDFGFLSIQVA